MTSLSETSLLAGASGQSTGYTIDQSIRFNDNDSPILKKTYSGAGTEETFTFSCWVKRGNLSGGLATSGGATLFSGGASVNNYGEILFRGSSASPGPADCLEFYNAQGGSTNMRLFTNQLFRDTNAWYHIVCVMDTTNAVSTERLRMYVNGNRVTDFNATTFPSQNVVPHFNTATEHGVGGFAVSTDTRFFDGYLAEIYFLDGYAYNASYFGEFKENTDIWIPKEYEGSYGTNGFHIDGRDSSDLGDDESGQGNDYSASGLAADDQVLDSPTNNHGVFNYLEKDLRYSTTLSNGNKTITFPSGSSGYSGTRLGLFRSNGKAYAEFKVGQTYSHTNSDGIAVFVSDDTNTSVSAGGGGNSSYTGSYNALNGRIYAGGSSQGDGTSWNSVGAVIGVYVDFDSGKGWFSKDGTVQTVNGTPNVSNGTNPHFTFTANTPLTVGAGGVHYATVGIVTLQNHVDEWSTTPTGYTPFSTLAEGEA